MIHRSVREWEYLPIEGLGGGAFDRTAANRMLRIARNASIGGEDGVRILLDHHTRLRAQQVVGVIAAEGVSLEILPKIDGADSDREVRHRLVQMLSVVLDLDIASGRLTDLGVQNESLLEILIRLFCDLLFAAVHRGLPRRYVAHEDDLPALRGRLDMHRQFCAHHVRGTDDTRLTIATVSLANPRQVGAALGELLTSEGVLGLTDGSLVAA